MNKYQAIVFDWDGTLFDSERVIVQLVKTAAQRAGLPTPPTENIRNGFGLKFEEVAAKLFPSAGEDKIGFYSKLFHQYLDEGRFGYSTLFDGAVETIKHLCEKGYQLAIATGKSRATLASELKRLNLDSYFKTTRTPTETKPKPHPQMLLEIIAELGIPGEQALMIGDTEYDMQLAANAGVDALAVTYGVQPKHVLEPYQPKGFLDQIRDLPEWLGLRPGASAQKLETRD